MAGWLGKLWPGGVKVCCVWGFCGTIGTQQRKNPMKHENLLPLHLRIPKKHLDVLQAQADREFLKLSDIVRRALREWLEMKGVTTEQRNG